MRPSDLAREFGNPVAYYPGLVKHLGSVNAVLIFCQFFYWTGKESSSLGIYKSVEDIERETGLGYREQATARKQLVSKGVLIETHKRLEHKIYFKIDTDRLDEIIGDGLCNSRNAQNAVGETTNPHSGMSKSAFRGDTNPQFDHTENTSKNTTEITTENIGAQAEACTPKKGSGQDYSVEFEQAWQAYPKRAGGNPKQAAWKSWLARIREGIKPADMLAGVQRYAAYITATGKAGSEYVKQASTFFGPDHHFAESWTAPAQQQRSTPAQSRHSGFSERDYGTTTKPSWSKRVAE